MKPVAAVAIACLSWPVVLSGQTHTGSSPVLERAVYLMGTRATLAVRTHNRVAGLAQLEGMVRLLEETEASLSTWRPDSELSRLNRHPLGESSRLPASLCAVWPELVYWHRQTDGLFDPTIGALSEAWGIREGGQIPSPEELGTARSRTGFSQLEFESKTCRVTRRAEVMLDAGAFGKGEALRRVATTFASDPSWMVDLGGQIAVSGQAGAMAWSVAIAHPRYRDRAVLEVDLATGSIATSGVSERSQVIEGRWVAHILDPRSGEPVHRAFSVSVWSPDALTADILSTALYVMDIETGLPYANQHGVAALFLEPMGPDDQRVRLRPSLAFTERFSITSGPFPRSSR